MKLQIAQLIKSELPYISELEVTPVLINGKFSTRYYSVVALINGVPQADVVEVKGEEVRINPYSSLIMVIKKRV